MKEMISIKLNDKMYVTTERNIHCIGGFVLIYFSENNTMVLYNQNQRDNCCTLSSTQMYNIIMGRIMANKDNDELLFIDVDKIIKANSMDLKSIVGKILYDKMEKVYMKVTNVKGNELFVKGLNVDIEGEFHISELGNLENFDIYSKS